MITVEECAPNCQLCTNPEVIEVEWPIRVWIVTLMNTCLMTKRSAKSNSACIRLIKDGAVSVNGIKITNPQDRIHPIDGTIIKIGKTDIFKIKSRVRKPTRAEYLACFDNNINEMLKNFTEEEYNSLEK